MTEEWKQLGVATLAIFLGLKQEQSSMSKTERNQTKLFERLEKENRSNDIIPGNQENVRFWSRIWDQPARHNSKVQLLKKLETQLRPLRSKKTSPALARLWSRWTARILEKSLYILLWKNDCAADWAVSSRTVLIMKK